MFQNHREINPRFKFPEKRRIVKEKSVGSSHVVQNDVIPKSMTSVTTRTNAVSTGVSRARRLRFGFLRAIAAQFVDYFASKFFV
jgi:hypothetical protein